MIFAGFALGLISEFIYSVDSQFFVTIFLSIALIFLCFSLSALYAGEVGDVFVGGEFKVVFCIDINFLPFHESYKNFVLKLFNLQKY